MTQTRFKKIPFDLELAKKITNKEMKGRIVTRDGRQARIICFDRKETDDIFDPPKNIIALVENKDGSEGVFAFRDDGMIFLNEETDYDLQIEVPTYYRDYSNFIPQKWQPCLVRDVDNEFGMLQSVLERILRVLYYFTVQDAKNTLGDKSSPYPKLPNAWWVQERATSS